MHLKERKKEAELIRIYVIIGILLLNRIPFDLNINPRDLFFNGLINFTRKFFITNIVGTEIKTIFTMNFCCLLFRNEGHSE